MTDTGPSPRWRRWLRPTNLLLLALWIYLGVKIAPHIGAAIGVETGDRSRPAFALAGLDGGLIASDSLRGRVVLVNFWATWCLPCRVEMPLLQAMAVRHQARGLTVVGLSVDTDSPESVRTFLAERGVTYPVAMVGSKVTQAFGGVTGYPTSFLLDRDGRIRHRALGPLAMASFEPAVRRLLDEATAPAVNPTLPERSAPVR